MDVKGNSKVRLEVSPQNALMRQAELCTTAEGLLRTALMESGVDASLERDKELTNQVFDKIYFKINESHFSSEDEEVMKLHLELARINGLAGRALTRDEFGKVGEMHRDVDREAWLEVWMHNTECLPYFRNRMWKTIQLIEQFLLDDLNEEDCLERVGPIHNEISLLKQVIQLFQVCCNCPLYSGGICALWEGVSAAFIISAINGERDPAIPQNMIQVLHRKCKCLNSYNTRREDVVSSK